MKNWTLLILAMATGPAALATTSDLGQVTNELYIQASNRSAEAIEIPAHGTSIPEYRYLVMKTLAESTQPTKIAVLPTTEEGRAAEFFLLGKTPRNENCLVKLSHAGDTPEAPAELTLIAPSTAGLSLAPFDRLPIEMKNESSSIIISGTGLGFGDAAELENAHINYQIQTANDGSLKKVIFKTTYSQKIFPRTFLGKLWDGLQQTGPHYQRPRKTVTQIDECRL